MGKIMNKNEIINQYLKLIKKQFKIYHTKDERFISDLRNAVICFAEQQNPLNYEQLILQFGDPQELVANYFSEQSLEKQKKHLQLSWKIKTACIIITCLVLMCCSIYVFKMHQQHKQELDTFIQKEITILEEDSQ